MGCFVLIVPQVLHCGSYPLLIQSLGVALCHGVDYGDDKIRYHDQQQVAKHLLQSAALLRHKGETVTNAAKLYIRKGRAFFPLQPARTTDGADLHGL